MAQIDILVIPLGSFLQVGIYRESKLIKTYEVEGKTSDVLPKTFEDILKEYPHLGDIYYVNGPGSYMAIKVAYLFLKSLCVVKELDLYAADGFHFNNNSPIKALGKKYFFKQHDGTINIDFLDDSRLLQEFRLPEVLNKKIFETNSLPNYNLPAI